MVGTMSDDDDLYLHKFDHKKRRVRSIPHFEDPGMRRRFGSDVEPRVRKAPIRQLEGAEYLEDKDAEHLWGRWMVHEADFIGEILRC